MNIQCHARINPITDLKGVLQQALKCLGCCLLGVAAAHAESGTTTTGVRSANWQQVVLYIIHQLPACKEYPQSAAVASIRGDRISLYYPDRDYGTTDSFPFRVPFTAEAHSADGSWRLFVRFRRDVVTTDIPNLNGHGQSNLFFCDGDRDTTEGLATALTRLRELLTGGSAAEPNSDLPEATVRSRRVGEGEPVTLTERVNIAGLNLSTPAGVDELRARITNVARGLCRELDVLYPDSASTASGHQFTTESCVRDAVADAVKHVRERIAAVDK